MKYIHLCLASLCAFAASFQFDGGLLDAGNISVAVLNFGLFLDHD